MLAVGICAPMNLGLFLPRVTKINWNIHTLSYYFIFYPTLSLNYQNIPLLSTNRKMHAVYTLKNLAEFYHRKRHMVFSVINRLHRGGRGGGGGGFTSLVCTFSPFPCLIGKEDISIKTFYLQHFYILYELWNYKKKMQMLRSLDTEPEILGKFFILNLHFLICKTQSWCKD